MDCYKILEISKTCTQEEIKKAYKKLALKWHPDKNLDNIKECEDKFKEISNAYDKINTVEKKQLYDNPPVRNNLVINFGNNNHIINIMNMMNQMNMQPRRHINVTTNRRRIIKKVHIINGVRHEEIIIISM